MTNGQGPMGPVQDPIRQTILRGIPIFVVPNVEAGVRSIVVDTPSEQLVFPLSNETAQIIGHALAAPSVIRPGDGG